MADEDDPKLKAHVKRIFKIAVNPKTKQEAIVSDFFIDVRRIDRLPIKFQASQKDGIEGQIIRLMFNKWNDDYRHPITDVDDTNADLIYENANARRKTARRRIVDPDVKSDVGKLPQGASDSTTSIDDNDIYLWLAERVRTKQRGFGPPKDNQAIQYVFNNAQLKDKIEKDTRLAKRRTTVVKVVNNDLGGLPMTDAAGKPVPVDWETYKTALQNGEVDKEEANAKDGEGIPFLTEEITDRFIVRFGPSAPKGLENQTIAIVLQSKRIKDLEGQTGLLFKKGDRNIKDANGKSALIRIDPLQTIVNVGSNIIAVEFLPKAE